MTTWKRCELVPVFSEGGHHHIPIISVVGRLVGIVTQSDMVAALFEVPAPPSAKEGTT